MREYELIHNFCCNRSIQLPSSLVAPLQGFHLIILRLFTLVGQFQTPRSRVAQYQTRQFGNCVNMDYTELQIS